VGTFPKSAGELNTGKSNTGDNLSALGGRLSAVNAVAFDDNKYVVLLPRTGSPGMAYPEVESGAGAI
jgi:hypothetical protein